jgi:hypothetical protein
VAVGVERLAHGRLRSCYASHTGLTSIAQMRVVSRLRRTASAQIDTSKAEAGRDPETLRKAGRP